MAKGRIRVKSDYTKYRVYICDHGTEMRPRWGKLDFEFVAFSVLYYIKKACVKIVWHYIKYFSRYGHLYINLTTNFAFFFNWFFILFIGLPHCSIPHSQIYNFLIVWIRLLIFGMNIHQLIWIHCSWYICSCDLDRWSQCQITDCNMKILCSAHNCFVIGFRL